MSNRQTVLCTSGANAVIVGDKDWLRVPVTTVMSWSDFDTIFDTGTGACDVVGCVIGGTIDLTGYEWASNTDVNAIFESHFSPAGMFGTNISQYAEVVEDAIDQLFVDSCPDARTSRQSRRPGRNVVRRWRQRNHLVGGGIMGATPRSGDSPWLAARYVRRLLVLQAPPPGPRSRLAIRRDTDRADLIREA